MSTVTDDETKSAISANLKRLRTSRGLSMAALARLIGDYPATIKRVEDGQNMPGAGLCTRIAEALGVTVDDLLATPRKKLSRAS